jgi:hypothetical protein
MKITKHLFVPAMLSAALLTACSQDNTASTVEKIKTSVAQNIETDMNKAITEAKSDLTDINISLKDGGQATIASNGDLKINGTAVALDQNQRTLTIAYYAATKKVAMQGMEIGKESAKLATQAIGSALGGLINGKAEAGIEKSLEAKADNMETVAKSLEAKAGNIEAIAQKLCNTALELQSIQAKLIVAVPQFTPEPMSVDTGNDGCSVKSGSDINLNINGNPPEPPAAPAPPPEPPAPPKA